LSWIWPLPQTTEGWIAAAGLLVLPILTVVTQLIVQKMMTPASGDSQQAMMGQMMMFMPIMFGFFALQVPQGLVLYWVVSNVFALAQQYFINKQHQPLQPAIVDGAAVPVTKTAESTSAATVGVRSSTTAGVPKRTKDARRKNKR